MKFAEYLNNRRLLIFAKDEEQQRKILNKKTINGEKVKSHIPGAVAKMRGVISGVSLSISIEDIVSEFREKGVKASY